MGAITHPLKEQPARVLIADDDESVRGFLCRVAKSAGYIPIPCSSGRHAIEFLNTATPDLFVLDGWLGDMDAFKLCSVLRSIPRTSATPIIILTGVLTEARHALRARKFGAFSFQKKPVTFSLMLAEMRRALNSRTTSISKRPVQSISPTTQGLDAEQRHPVLADVAIDPKARRVRFRGRISERLSPRAFQFVSILLGAYPEAVPRSTLSEVLFAEPDPIATKDGLNSLVKRLRRQLPAEFSAAIQSIRGAGYQFSSDLARLSKLQP